MTQTPRLFMMKAVKTIALFLSIFVIASHAQAVVLKLSTTYPNGTAIVKTLKQAGKDIHSATEGRVTFKFYPGGVHGDNQTVLKKIKRGILHGGIFETGAFGDDYRDGQIYNAPMAFTSFDEVDYVRAKLDQDIIAGFKQHGWTMFGFIDGGFAYAMTKKPVSSIDDLRKQKLWLPSNDPYSQKIADGLNMSPIYLGYGEVLTALQTGAINAIIAPPSAALTLQWYSRVDYITNLPFIYTMGTLALSNKAFNKIPAADQAVVEKIFSEALQALNASAREDNIRAFDAMKSQGLTFVTPSGDDLASFNASGESATQTLLNENELSQEIYNTLLQHLKDYRSANSAAQ